ncbi:Domain of unknown function (DUF1823) [Seminavis robusta]|uniref:Uncharacterized protein n=1 Tax=Seminavis robusta TaxID=568900 RepID=A0A9N8H0X1_9STRA|nr:Domain of unknown function (DUF1823) [Seminavis robusta]|eukprot:Sro28_g018910.1 Domain of unknown function (DUF1823) (270) ;mRNA; f:161254-162157
MTMRCLCLSAVAALVLAGKTSAFVPLATSSSLSQGKILPSNSALQEGSEGSESEDKEKTEVTPIILDAFPEAADPLYPSTGPIGEGDFVISREGGPTREELANENILRIVKSECTDLEVNTLVWKGLGYRFNTLSSEWESTECFPKWKEKYPTPPDLIGMQRMYSREIDQISLRSNQALVKSVPVDNKQSLKEHMKPLGWKGFQYKELTPNLTRRAQCANWLVFYREELFGYTIEELREKRQKKKEAEQAKKMAEGTQDEWSPPVKEVY